MAKRIIPGLFLLLTFTIGFLALDAQNADESKPVKREKAKKEKQKRVVYCSKMLENRNHLGREKCFKMFGRKKMRKHGPNF